MVARVKEGSPSFTSRAKLLERTDAARAGEPEGFPLSGGEAAMDTGGVSSVQRRFETRYVHELGRVHRGNCLWAVQEDRSARERRFWVPKVGGCERRLARARESDFRGVWEKVPKLGGRLKGSSHARILSGHNP